MIIVTQFQLITCLLSEKVYNYFMNNLKKGIILAGGNGTRLGLLTSHTNKHLLPVYSKPMILYPLQTLLDMGIKDILIVTGGKHLGHFTDLLGSGSKFGCRFTYRVQDEAGGIAQALSLGEDFVDGPFTVILGDNFFEYAPVVPSSCGIVLKEVADPKRFGVYSPEKNLIIEKPEKPDSSYAVTGLYFYDPKIFDFIKTLEPSARGELEITSVNNWCLENLPTAIIHYQGYWSDMGTPNSLLVAANWIKDHLPLDK